MSWALATLATDNVNNLHSVKGCGVPFNQRLTALVVEMATQCERSIDTTGNLMASRNSDNQTPQIVLITP